MRIEMENSKSDARLSMGRQAQRLAEDAKKMRDDVSKKITENIFSPNLDDPKFFDLCIKEFANGNVKPALTEMVKKFKQQKGMGINQKYWYCLFDCYLFIGDKAYFDKLADAYNRAFELSPPGWGNIKTEKLEGINSRSVLSIVDNPNKISKEKFADFIKVARDNRVCRIELSRINLDELEEIDILEGLQKIYELMVVIENNDIHCDVIGDITLNQQLLKRIQDQIAGAQKQEHIYWDLYLKLLQWRGEEEAYNRIHSQYSLYFDEMPLDFRKEKVMQKMEETLFNFNDKDVSITDDIIELPNVIGRNEVQEMISIINRRIVLNKTVDFDFSNVKMFNYLAANDFAQFLLENESKVKSKVRFFNVFQIIACLFDLTAISKKIAVFIHKY